MQEVNEIHQHRVKQRPYWQRAHRDWRFWIGVVCIFVALAIYISTVDLSLVPSKHPHSVPASE
jgi:hypothetical protein